MTSLDYQGLRDFVKKNGDGFYGLPQANAMRDTDSVLALHQDLYTDGGHSDVSTLPEMDQITAAVKSGRKEIEQGIYISPSEVTELSDDSIVSLSQIVGFKPFENSTRLYQRGTNFCSGDKIFRMTEQEINGDRKTLLKAARQNGIVLSGGSIEMPKFGKAGRIVAGLQNPVMGITAGGSAAFVAGLATAMTPLAANPIVAPIATLALLGGFAIGALGMYVVFPAGMVIGGVAKHSFAKNLQPGRPLSAVLSKMDAAVKLTAGS